MGIFTPDLAAVDAGFPLYEKGMYRVKVVSRTPFVEEKEDKQKPGTMKLSAGLHWKLEMYGMVGGDGEISSTDEAGREIRGKAVSRNTFYLHNEGGWSFGKLFLMAALGFDKNEENEFNAIFQENREAFSFSGEPGDTAEALEENLGSGWNLPVDRFVDVYLKKDVRVHEGTTYEDQKFSAWQPVGERAEF
jgi:hypothetical protein